MNESQKYLLLLDPREEVLSLQQTALACFYGGEVFSFSDSTEAMEILKSRGTPEMIIMDSSVVTEKDSQFYRHLEDTQMNVPIIATSVNPDDSLLAKYPNVTAVIEKPVSAQAFTYLVKSLTSLPHQQPTHVPIKFSVLLRMGIGYFDLYLKLSDTNFVKILHKGESFYEADAKKLFEKGISELYIKFEDSKEFLAELEKSLTETTSINDDITLTLENLESFERVAKALKWSPSVLISAQKSVGQAVKILSKNKNVLGILKKRLSEPSSDYSRHIGLQTYLVCAFCSNLGYAGDSAQVKLALASLIHDVAVDEDFYKNIKAWNKKASDPTDKSAETLRYRMHPFEGSKIARTLDNLSPDVDQIILQHHEVKDGKGFPRGIDSGRIGHLPALFIIVEDLVEFIDKGENIETSIIDFITWGREYYSTGHFKKIFVTFEENLKI